MTHGGPAAGFTDDPPVQLPPPGDLVIRRSSVSQVSLYLRRVVFDGLLRPGDRIPQDAVAERLGLSRAPVREALLALQNEGWVTSIPNRGAFISALDESRMRDHYELFGHIYSLAAARAAERRTNETVAELARLQKTLQSLDDPQQAWQANAAFQRFVIDLARSPALHAMLATVTEIVPGNFFELVPGALRTEKTGTAAIVRAIRRGDAESASREYVMLMQRQGELAVALFRKRGLLADQP